ncbi:MAG: ABC transporter ATP-binding protein [Ruminococcaceae bacterium]|nr:ABC transporter ATP-binding protein [Oscillospiraceae bacterium]
MDAIKTVKLTKKYKDTVAVDALDLTVKEGELFALLGVNGAGKTTTVKMLSCLTRPTGGEAFLDGKSVLTDAEKIKRIIGVSPQETAVASGLTVGENLELICDLYGFSKEKQKEKIKELSALVDYEKTKNKKAGKLSGGMKRRLSIAMSLISEPKILFLDEPTLGLDVISRRELWDIIEGLKGKMTVILTTHYMEEAEALSDRVGIMKDGKLLICGTPEGIKTAASSDRFEDAFIKIVREETK